MTDIGRVFLSKAWLFQAIVAGPTFVVLGMCAMFAIWEATYWTVYDFLTFSCTAIMAGGIIFVVLVQRQLPTAGKLWTFRFELTKSALATAMWIWLMADAIWGPNHGSSEQNLRRVIMSAIAANFLFIFFYPTLVYTFFVLDRHQHENRGAATAERGHADEDTPLLGDE